MKVLSRHSPGEAHDNHGDSQVTIADVPVEIRMWSVNCYTNPLCLHDLDQYFSAFFLNKLPM
jgi:hypothetical protein